MTLPVKDWLPRGAFSDDAVKAVLSEPVARWSQRWIARGTAAISAVRRASPRDADGAVAEGELSGPAKRRLLEAMLDVDLKDQMLGEADHLVLDDFANQAVKDLLAALNGMFGTDKAEGGACIRFAIALGAEEVLAVFLPEDVLVPLLKTRCGSYRAVGAKPRSRVEALAPVRVVAQAVLGAADLALADLRGLAVGDVVILDRALQEPVELRLAEGGRRIARGKLGRDGARISIQL